MKEDEIQRQVNEMADKGIKGFFIHPRQGMEIPYLSKEYFNRVSTAVAAAKQRNLEVWLYDEYPYPSGISGGEVILDHPEFLCKHIKKVEAIVKQGETLKLHAPWGRVLSAKAYRIYNDKVDFTNSVDVSEYIGTGYSEEIFQLSGLTAYNKKRYFTGNQNKVLLWQPGEGSYKVYIFVEVVFKHFKYYENFVDPLNKAAVEYFIKTTHEQYKKHVGKEFGKTIKGIFSDEIGPFPPGQPWSPLLPELVKERHGIDLIKYLPALWEDMGEETVKVRYAYWNTVTEQFIASYDKPVYEWCENNNLLYVAEKPILRSKQLEYIHVPGIDTGHQKVGTRAAITGKKYRENGKMVSSAMHFYHKKAALCEAFHSIGWGMTMQDMKWTFDWLALTGIDWFVVHGYFYTTDGLKKHDAPPSAFFQMPWFRNMNTLSDYADRLSNFLRSTKREVKLLVIDPITSTWTQEKENKNKLNSLFSKMQNEMLYNQLDYYIIDPYLFAEGKVITEGSRTCFSLKGEVYDVVILPPMTNLEDRAFVKLKEYIKAGGKVTGFGVLPFETIETLKPAGEMEDLFGVRIKEVLSAFETGEEYTIEQETTLFTTNLSKMLQWLKKEVVLEWTIEPLDSLGFDEMPSIQSRNKNGDVVLFLMNLGSKKRSVKVCSQKLSQILELAPYESVFIDNSYVAKEKQEYVLNLKQKLKRKLLHKNPLRIGIWKAVFANGEEAYVDSCPIIDQLEASQVKLPIKQKKYFGCVKELEFNGIPVAYEYEFDCSCEISALGEVLLVMEPETVTGDYKIYLNDNYIDTAEFMNRNIYLPTNLAIRVDSYLKKGRNKINIQVDIKNSSEGIRNPMYLFGDFEVAQVEKYWCLQPLKKDGTLDVISSGIPFYAGTIEYELEVKDLVCTKDDVTLTIKEKGFEDCVTLCVNGYWTKVCPFGPYEFTIPKHVIQEINSITLTIDTTAIGIFEGQQFNHEKHCYESVEK